MKNKPSYEELKHGSKELANITTAQKKAEEDLRLYGEIIANLSEGVYLIRLNDVAIVYANPKFERMFGYRPGELVGKHASILHAPSIISDKATPEEIMEVVNKTGEWHGEVNNIKKDGTQFWCHANISIFDHSEFGKVLVAVHSDITRRKEAEIEQATMKRRLEALWKLSRMVKTDFKAICDTVLEEIVSMTKSRYGFYGFLNDDESVMTVYSWSRDALINCALHDKPLLYPIESSGIWANAIRDRKPYVINDYSLENPNKKGTPEGHVQINRILSVPIFFKKDRIVAIGCVAIKKEDYDNGDVNQLIAYLNSAQILLESRKIEEDRQLLLEKALSELKVLRGILPLCSFCKKIRDDNNGRWENVDVYIDKYSQADITHSICPDCLKKHYAEDYEDMTAYKKEE
jgi:PAS domain S-box-containing protein